MRRILISIFCVFMIFSAFGVGENIPTSKSYVDAEIATKQDKISANNGAAQVLTNTGTAGEYGTKNIYDSTGSYATQTDALIDAVTMNTAVQNAIDSEFQCVEYNPNDPNDCWLMDVRGETGKKGPNLLNPELFVANTTIRESDGELTDANYFAVFGPIRVIPGERYTFSGKANTPGGLYKRIYGYDANDNFVSRLANVGATTNKYVITITIPENVYYVKLTGIYYRPGISLNDTNLQFERGAIATPYSAYGSNLYIPSGN